MSVSFNTSNTHSLPIPAELFLSILRFLYQRQEWDTLISLKCVSHQINFLVHYIYENPPEPLWKPEPFAEDDVHNNNNKNDNNDKSGQNRKNKWKWRSKKDIDILRQYAYNQGLNSNIYHSRDIITLSHLNINSILSKLIDKSIRLRLHIHPTLHGGPLMTIHSNHTHSSLNTEFITLMDGSTGLESIKYALIRLGQSLHRHRLYTSRNRNQEEPNASTNNSSNSSTSVPVREEHESDDDSLNLTETDLVELFDEGTNMIHHWVSFTPQKLLNVRLKSNNVTISDYHEEVLENNPNHTESVIGKKDNYNNDDNANDDRIGMCIGGLDSMNTLNPSSKTTLFTIVRNFHFIFL